MLYITQSVVCQHFRLFRINSLFHLISRMGETIKNRIKIQSLNKFLLIQMQREYQQRNTEQESLKPKLDLKLIENKYSQYRLTPELYLIAKIEKHNPWPHRNIADIRLFLQQTTALYNAIPYHNVTHAFDVMVHLDLYLSEYRWQHRLQISQQKAIMMLIAAYAHDSGHQGLTNSFYKNSKHALSLSSQSPLQAMHASNLMRLLSQNNLEIDQTTRHELTEMILKTDNFYHHQLILEAKNLQGLTENELKMPKNTLLVQCLLLHAADLNNTAKETELTLLWTGKLYEQFQYQNRLQKERGLPLTWTLGTQEQRIRSNILFFDHLVLPLFRSISCIEPRFGQIVAKIQKNKAFYLLSLQKFT